MHVFQHVDTIASTAMMTMVTGTVRVKHIATTWEWLNVHAKNSQYARRQILMCNVRTVKFKLYTNKL